VKAASALTAAEIQQRSSRFASLRAAQRALSELVHPAQLEQGIEQGRKILIELIGDGLRRQGVDDVVLRDQHDTAQVRYGDGKILEVAPKGDTRKSR
jgi:hypothetical protein